MTLLDFKFAVEQLTPEKQQASAAALPTTEDISALLFKSKKTLRLEADERDAPRKPEKQYGVVHVFADTSAFFCCRCTRLGFKHSVKFCAFNLYRLSLTRAEWIWVFNLVCLVAHVTMAWLCLTACNGDRFGTRINPECTAFKMSVPLFRAASNCEEHCSNPCNARPTDEHLF